ncbi:outer membrane lipoprotein carrier protein LolA [Roseomonas frigidaquae]|uniref:Outer membrane lipoprotein carrier protein LolA n=1 Tax=Falsiroseomonas frigidaquae TaxID=487318 RepID=A0ABX1EXM8_9PROT|nr:outer membrane lipoprotein carrier protein LolA [Falsiroseomonas frigidaquae]NKE44814.1 outer membrane lipoprotein carrier protein LolA [Falsiroseomonas frigidaquae]
MKRRLILAAGLAAPFLVPAAAGTARAQSIDRTAVARVEAYLNTLRTLRARFLQVAQNGASAQGTALISRPGRMRFDYDPPEPLLLVASGGQVLMYDRELRQPTAVPASSTPLGLLLTPEIRLAGDITVVGTDRTGGFLRIGLYRTGARAEGLLTLAFAEQPMELRQWTVLDAQGRETRVTLYEVETGIALENRLFDFNDPRFLEAEAARR